MVITNTESPFVLRDERLCFGPRHAGQVVNIQVALSAETRALVTDHLFPVSVTRCSDSHVIERTIESRHEVTLKALSDCKGGLAGPPLLLELVCDLLWRDVTNPLQISQRLKFLER
jgi:hypothetical protein